jgi:RHS repeat-associated protein
MNMAMLLSIRLNNGFESKDGIITVSFCFDYLGTFVYTRDNDTLIFESTSFGGRRINKTGNNNYDINYFITDHLGSTRVIVDNSGTVLGRNDYYPFGKLWEGGTVQAPTTRYTFSGKEKQTVRDLGWLDFSARMMNGEIPIFTTQDPLAEKYYSISPYAYCAGNPVKYIDPDGMDINFYHFQYDEKRSDLGTWEQGLNKETEKILEAFAKTKIGYAFLSQYAKAGQKIGDVEFKTDGKYVDHNLNFNEYNESELPYPSNTSNIKDNKINFNIRFDNSRADAEVALTIGHEILLHMDVKDDKLINAFNSKGADGFKQEQKKQNEISGNLGHNDHKNYINGVGKGFVSFNTYISQLKPILGTQNINQAKKKHDENYNNLKTKK